MGWVLKRLKGVLVCASCCSWRCTGCSSVTGTPIASAWCSELSSCTFSWLACCCKLVLPQALNVKSRLSRNRTVTSDCPVPIFHVNRCVVSIGGLSPSASRSLFALFLAGRLACLLPTRGMRHRRYARALRQTGYAGDATAAHILAGELGVLTLTGGKLAHHGAHFIKLFKQLVDKLHGGATAVGDTLATAPVNNIGIAPLLTCHRKDDGLDVLELIAFQCLLHLRHCHQLVRAWNHLQHRAQWPHAFQLAHSAEKILQVELALLELGLRLERLFLVNRLLCALDQRENVAHTQDTRGEALRVEGFQCI